MKLNLIVFALLLPAECFLGLAGFFYLAGGWPFWLFAALALSASLVVGPTLTALFLAVTKMLRDEPGFVWHDFKTAFRKNFRQTACVGLLFSLVVASWVLAWFLLAATTGVGTGVLVVFLLSMLLLSMASPYYFLQAGYLQLGNGALLKNSLLLAMAHAPRSLAAALLGAGLVLLQFLLLPLSVPALLLFGYSLPALLALFFIWPPVDKQFSIHSTLRQRTKSSDTETENEQYSTDFYD